MKYYLPIVAGRPAAWDGDQLAFCDDLSHWQDTPHVARLYTSLDALKAYIEKSQAFRKKARFSDIGKYGWVEVADPVVALPSPDGGSK